MASENLNIEVDSALKRVAQLGIELKVTMDEARHVGVVLGVQGIVEHKQQDQQGQCRRPAKIRISAVIQTALWPPPHWEAQLLGIKCDSTSQLQSWAALQAWLYSCVCGRPTVEA